MSSSVALPQPNAARLKEADAVIKSWKTFSRIYKSRRSTFQRKWTKLSNSRKIGIVKKHWLPLAMPTQHRPDLDNSALWRAPGVQNLLHPEPFDEPEMDKLLWPYFNIETLTTSDRALSQLMESRSDIHPRVFSRLDLINPVNKKLHAHFGLDIKPSRGNSSTQFSDIDPQARDAEDPDSSYGDLISISNASIMNALQTIESFSEQEGVRVMEVQKKIYDFLGKVCDEVLEAEDTGRGTASRASTSGAASSPDEDAAGEPTLPLKPALDFEPSDPAQEGALQHYLKLHHDLDPYSHPAEVDWEYLGVLAHHQLRISEDRLRSLKEDPGKFLEYLQHVRDHSQSMLVYHPSGQGDPLVKKGTDLVNKERCALHLQTAFSTLTDAVDTWQAIFTLVEKLREMRHKHDGPHVDLLENSDEYAAYMLGIIRAGHHYKSNSVDLLRAMRCSETMRGYFRVSQINWDIELLGPKPKNNAERELVALASTLSNNTIRGVFGEWTIFEEIYDLVKSKSRITNPYLAGIAQDLNSLGSVMLVPERVWHSTHRYDLDINAVDLVRGALDYARPLQRLRDLDKSDANGVLQNLVQDYLKRPLKDHFTFKTQGRMAKRDYDANAEALTNLAGFWDAAEVMLGTEDVGALSDTVKELLATAQPLTVARPDQRTSTATTRTTKMTTSEEAAGSSVFYTGGNDTPRMTFEERRVKEKTRPEVILTLDVPPPAAPPVPAVYPDIQLPLQHYNTIRMLMGPAIAARPGTIPWAAVVGCLVAMGFNYNTGQGSARVFEPSVALMESQVSLALKFLIALYALLIVRRQRADYLRWGLGNKCPCLTAREGSVEYKYC